MEKAITIRRWIEKFNAGLYASSNIDIQIEAGWYDWFCRDSSLANKTQKLGKNLIAISKSKKIDIDKQYVFFKNNCPMTGNLYDDFRICDIETGEVIYTVTPKSGHNSDNGLGEVWGKSNDFDGSIFKGTWTEIKKWFNN